MHSRVSLAAAILAPAALAHAEVIEVPRDHPTIQAAIDAALDGDVVLVSPGSYSESINPGGREITLRSIDPLDPAIVAATIIDGQGLDARPVTCDSGESQQTVIAGFTIGGGAAVSGGGMLCTAGSSPSVRGCVFRDNNATDGGGIRIDGGGSPLVSRCRFMDNTALGGGFGGGVSVEGASATLLDCTFINNHATFGGALAVEDGTLEARGCRLRLNTALGGGGLAAYDSDVLLADSLLRHNNSTSGGGGGAEFERCDAEITGCFFERNSTSLYGSGGGVEFAETDADVHECTFFQNRAESGGGAIHGVHASVNLVDVTLCGNEPVDFSTQVAGILMRSTRGCEAARTPGRVRQSG